MDTSRTNSKQPDNPRPSQGVGESGRPRRSEEKRAYDRAYHAARSPEKKARKIALQAARRAGLYDAVARYKSGISCDCGETHPACLEFHHVGDDKEISVGDAAGRGWSISRLMAEIAKCRPICSNCHRKLHFAEKAGSNPAALTIIPANREYREHLDKLDNNNLFITQQQR